MPISASRTARRAAAFALAAALAAPAAAAARPVTASLRVEAGGSPLVNGAAFASDTTRIQADQAPGCDGSGRVTRLAGPTALGLVVHAGRIERRLRPVSVSDRFSFGIFVCGLGAFVGEDTRFWLYKVNHVAPELGADKLALKGGDEVLWYFQNTASGSNTGDELVLSAPARARSGRSFEVTVHAYDAAGRRTPAAGALVFGETVQRTGADGKARIFSDRVGTLALRARRGGDIPSARVGVCLAALLRRCAAVRGKRIFGTNLADRLQGGRGPDVVEAGGGPDRVLVRGGGRDRVRCGAGRDLVRADHGDRTGRDCEVVARP